MRVGLRRWRKSSQRLPLQHSNTPKAADRKTHSDAPAGRASSLYNFHNTRPEMIARSAGAGAGAGSLPRSRFRQTCRSILSWLIASSPAAPQRSAHRLRTPFLPPPRATRLPSPGPSGRTSLVNSRSQIQDVIERGDESTRSSFTVTQRASKKCCNLGLDALLTLLGAACLSVSPAHRVQAL